MIRELYREMENVAAVIVHQVEKVNVALHW
jgi:hypothetical protein